MTIDIQNCDCKELQLLGKEFCEAAKVATDIESLNAGLKCFQLAWMNCKLPEDPPFEDIESRMLVRTHEILFKIISDVYWEHYWRIEGYGVGKLC